MLFSSCFQRSQLGKLILRGLNLQRLNHIEAEGLEQPLTEEEIHDALMGMNGDKAPGLDGFTVAFWQSFLIPKKEGVDDPGDFWPISLLGGLYKLLAKVLANRLKKVLDKVVIFPIPGSYARRSTLSLPFCVGYRSANKARSPYLSKLDFGMVEVASGLKINLAKSEVIPVREVEDINELVVELGKSNWCWDNIEFKVGEGTKVNFWTGSVVRLEYKISKNSNDWELDSIGELFHMLRDLRISPEEDSVIWKGGGHGHFRIRDAYKLLIVPSDITFTKKSIWVDKVPTKVVFFCLGGYLGEGPNFG
ncbi:hypothetical protein CK203_084954 [Vitis vinifera]|uniref:Reverse transcriptase domain-containing protein n=1 Tax=Vitis vinifera TaxID=29760 RepID=A0A438CXH1_VITVI|nr:hypothetical protein CK203_084954 [Vitis vinifera]